MARAGVLCSRKTPLETPISHAKMPKFESQLFSQFQLPVDADPETKQVIA